MNFEQKEKALSELKLLKEKGLISTPTKKKREEEILSDGRPNFELNTGIIESVRNYRDMAAGARGDQILVMQNQKAMLARGAGAASGTNYNINFSCFYFCNGKFQSLNIPKKVRHH